CRTGGGKLIEDRAQLRRIGRRRVPQCRPDQPLAFDQFEGDVLARRLFIQEIVAPALEAVSPRLDRVIPDPDSVGTKARLPAVILDWRERRLSPCFVLAA